MSMWTLEFMHTPQKDGGTHSVWLGASWDLAHSQMAFDWEGEIKVVITVIFVEYIANDTQVYIIKTIYVV